MIRYFHVFYFHVSFNICRGEKNPIANVQLLLENSSKACVGLEGICLTHTQRASAGNFGCKGDSTCWRAVSAS